jgi:hypothetical protein
MRPDPRQTSGQKTSVSFSRFTSTGKLGFPFFSIFPFRFHSAPSTGTLARARASGFVVRLTILPCTAIIHSLPSSEAANFAPRA